MMGRLRGRVLGLLGVFVVTASQIALSAQAAGTSAPAGWSLPEIVTLPNLASLAVLIYHFGMLRQEFADYKRRLASMEEWRQSGAPDAFASHDALIDIRRRLERIEGKL